MDRIGIQEAISALRGELSESIRKSAGEDLRFQVGQITLEFRVEVERTAGGSGGIRFWVVEIGGEASRTSTLTHTVTVPLTPVGEQGGPVLTGGGGKPH